MYEVEIKVELTATEREQLIKTLEQKSFAFKKTTRQNDFYIEAHESPFGGYDLKRYRDENGKFIYTEKTLELIDNQPTRKENEYEVSKEEFRSAIAKFPNALTINKDREWFDGSYQGKSISITIDSVKFNHSPSMRYFIEAEIDTEDKNAVTKTRELLKEFLKDLLQKNEFVEAPGMFTMAFKKK